MLRPKITKINRARAEEGLVARIMKFKVRAGNKRAFLVVAKLLDHLVATRHSMEEAK
jgi:hypothetical protein